MIWVDIAKFIWLSDLHIFGAQYGAAVAVPYLINAHVSGGGLGGNFLLFKEGDVNGLGDINITPVILNWTNGNNHFAFSPTIVAATGGYSKDRILNSGRNTWAFDLVGSYTWFDPKLGIEVDLTPGVMFNATNPATRYHTGTEFHLDWLVGEHFSEMLAVGVTGYVFRQLSDDGGAIPLGIDASHFTGNGVGIGPAANVTMPIAGKPVSFTAKAVFDLGSHSRFEGNLYMLSVAFKF